MSNDWRDFEPGRTGVSVGQLADGEQVKAMVVSEPYREDTSQSENALHVPVVILEAPEGFADMSGESVEVSEESDGEPQEYNVINSSTAFFEALLDTFPEGSGIDGQVINIGVEQPTDEVYSRTYNVTVE